MAWDDVLPDKCESLANSLDVALSGGAMMVDGRRADGGSQRSPLGGRGTSWAGSPCASWAARRGRAQP